MAWYLVRHRNNLTFTLVDGYNHEAETGHLLAQFMIRKEAFPHSSYNFDDCWVLSHKNECTVAIRRNANVSFYFIVKYDIYALMLNLKFQVSQFQDPGLAIILSGTTDSVRRTNSVLSTVL
jgi:hypothetical protein